MRPLIRRQRLTYDGMLLVGMLTMSFFDPFDNYLENSFTYNAHFVQVDSWARFVPAWQSSAPFATPLLFALCAYVTVMFAMGSLGARLLRPLTTWRVAGVLALFATIDLAFENLLIRLDVMAYPGVPAGLSAWGGTQYQFPLYEPLLMAIWWLGMALAVGWRGRDRTPDRGGIRTAVALLSVVGFLHAWTLGLYFLPFNVLASQAGPPPELPSYLRHAAPGDAGSAPSQARPARPTASARPSA